MESKKEELMQITMGQDLETIREMRDSLSDFFASWVYETGEMGYLESEKLRKYTDHFTGIKDLLIEVEKFKIQNNHV